jgi:DNA-binding NtrC family response regulator
MKPRVMVIEDYEALAQSIKQLLEYEGHDVETAPVAEQGLARAREENFDVVVTDLQMPGVDGLEVVRQLHQAKPHLPVILMTAFHTTETAIEATKLGAFDYIIKSGGQDYLLDLLEMVSNAIASKRRMEETVTLGPVAPTRGDAIVGSSRQMQAVYKEIGRIASRPITVLIRGETGTGKELVARAIYQHSDRAREPFIVVNCVAIPETLLESELFGHEQGAFTGANSRRIGRFEQAHAGTIFLDEVGDMTMHTQARLLRVLQEKTIQRLGGRETIPVDARVIAATHRDLEAAIAQGTFREDLYYRLNVAVIQLPPLRDRRDDIPELVGYFIGRYAAELGPGTSSISDDALRFLQQHLWPGNVRELENVIRKALLLAHGYPISLEHIQKALAQPRPPRPTGNQPLAGYVAELLRGASRGELENIHSTLLEAVERELYTQAIALAQGNQAKAAKWLGISRPTMREKLLQYGLRPGADH